MIVNIELSVSECVSGIGTYMFLQGHGDVAQTCFIFSHVSH